MNIRRHAQPKHWSFWLAAIVILLVALLAIYDWVSPEIAALSFPALATVLLARYLRSPIIS